MNDDKEPINRIAASVMSGLASRRPPDTGEAAPETIASLDEQIRQACDRLDALVKESEDGARKAADNLLDMMRRVR